MNLRFVGITIETIGTLMVGIAAVSVHHRFLHERKVDSRVFRVMKLEQKLGILGMILVVIGYAFRVAEL